jgi:glycosyltransferase involved in cell wall biosynthesis
MRSGGRRIAVVINARWRRNSSIDFGGYCQELGRLGHSPTLVCYASDNGEQQFPVIEAGATEMEKERFWRGLAIEAAIYFNWLRAPRILAAMKQAGLFVISRGDTDGQASARVFPKAAWLALEDSKDGVLDRLGKIKHWMRRYFTLSGAEDRDLLETIDRTDAVAIECEEAAKNLRRILAHYQRSDLEGKLHVIPHSVSDKILAREVYTGQRPRTIICGGRWDDPQKDPHLLATVLERLLQRQDDLQVTIVGAGADHLFERLTHQLPRILWLRRVPREKVAELLANSRVILSSSRWEGFSIITLEALCMGCTFAAPPLPGFISVAEHGRYGTISSRRDPTSLVSAVEQELELWDFGSRVPADISSVWRTRTSNHAVVSDLLSLIT